MTVEEDADEEVLDEASLLAEYDGWEEAGRMFYSFVVLSNTLHEAREPDHEAQRVMLNDSGTKYGLGVKL